MSAQRRTAQLAALALTASFLLSACEGRADNITRSSMNPLSARLQPMFEQTRTVCFGRFAMQIPASATLVYGPAEADTPIEFFAGEAADLGQRLAARLVQVEQERKFMQESDPTRLRAGR